MFPVIHLFGRTFATYALMGVLGMVLGLITVAVRCRKLGVDTDNAVYIYVFAFLGILIGAKLLYIVTVLPDFIKDLPLLISEPSEFAARYFEGGLVFYGGLAGGILAAYLTARAYKTKLMDYVGVLLPAFILFAGFGRIGCFCAGCCYGIPTDLPIGVVFPECSVAAPPGIPLLPVQLFEAGFDFILFFILLFITKHPVLKHWSIRIYVSSYSVVRFLLEFIRGDSERKFIWVLSTSQWIAILAIICVIALSAAEYKIKAKKSACGTEQEK